MAMFVKGLSFSQWALFHIINHSEGSLRTVFLAPSRALYQTAGEARRRKSFCRCGRQQQKPAKLANKTPVFSHANIIETKLDDIVTLLGQYRERSVPDKRLTGQSSLNKEGNTPATTQASDQDYPSVPLPQPEQTSLPPRSGSLPIVPAFDILFLEAYHVLHEYMTIVLLQFPFVPLPSHNAYDMYKDKPLLLKTILWICRPPNQEACAAFKSWLRRHIAHQTVVLKDKSLELIQVIPVFLAW